MNSKSLPQVYFWLFVFSLIAGFQSHTAFAQGPGFNVKVTNQQGVETEQTKVGESLKVTLTSEAEGSTIDPKDVQWDGYQNYFEAPVTTSPVGQALEYTLNAIKPDTQRIILVGIGGQAVSFKLTIAPKYDATSFEFPTELSNAFEDAANHKPLTLEQDKPPYTYSVSIKGDPTPVGPDVLTARNFDTNVVDVSIASGKISIYAKNASLSVGNIDLYSGETLIKRIKFTVKQKVAKIHVPAVIELTKCSAEFRNGLASDSERLRICDPDLSDLGISVDGDKTKNNPALMDDLEVSVFGPQIASYDPSTKKLKALQIGTAQLSIRSKDGGQSVTVPLRVFQTSGKIEIKPETGFTVATNREIKITAVVLDDQQKERANPVIEWEFVDQVGGYTAAEARNYVLLSPQDSDTLRISLFNPPGTSNAIFAVKATFKENDVKVAEQVQTIVIQRDAQVTIFDFLKTHLKVVDSRTAKDLFGGVTDREYYVVEVRLLNNIKKTDTSNVGDSILVYAGSLEIMAAFEYKFKGRDWVMAVESEGSPLPNGVRLANNLVIPGRQAGKTNECRQLIQKHFILPYRPLEYESAVNTQDSRGDRSTRDRILKGVGVLSGAASFVGSVFSVGPSYSIVLDQMNNLLIPTGEKLFSGKRELYRQNVVSKALLPLVEIPFGGEVIKYIFVPKKSISAYVVRVEAGKNPEVLAAQVRIKGISGSDACAEVGVIKKQP